MNFARSIIFLLLPFCGVTCFAYETDTHRLLTKEALSRSVLSTDPSLMTSFGLGSISSAKFPSYVGETPTLSSEMPIPELLSHGAYHEDVIKLTISKNHFFDPQWNNGLGRGLSTSGTMGAAGIESWKWMLEQTNTYPDQYYSFRKAKGALYKAFTSASPIDRGNAFGLVFQSLGHIVHHIQDMAQPQHVRNEAHLHDELKLSFGIVDIDYPWAVPAAQYELYTKKNINPKIADILARNPYPAPSFDRMEKYWFTNVAGYIGMAEFTSKNYVTYSTGYLYRQRDGVWELSNNVPDFPLPNGANFDGSKKKVVSVTTKAVGLRTGVELNYPVNYVVGSVYDGNTASSRPDQRLGAESALGYAISRGVAPRFFSGFNEGVWEDGYNILFPRAVAFSTGIINHFFRERVYAGKSANSGGGNHEVVIGNETSYTMSGEYEIYTEDGDGVRAPAVSDTYQKSWTIPPGSGAILNPRWSMADSRVKKVIVVFTGNVGSESGACTGTVIAW